MSSSSSASAGICVEGGRLGFVLIPTSADQDQDSLHHRFWPAIIFPSKDALCRCLPSQRDMHMFNTEWRDHQMNQRGAWGEPNIPRPSGSRGGDVAMKVAFLLGNETPPSGTRSFPVYSQDVTSVHRGVPQKPYFSFAKKKRNFIRNMEAYTNHDRFLEALEIAERYSVNWDMNLLLSSMNWPHLPNEQWHRMQQPHHHWPDHPSFIPSVTTCKGTSVSARQNVSVHPYEPSANDIIASSQADIPSTGIQRRHECGNESKDADDDASDDESVVNVDSSGAYNVPTPSRDGLLSQTSKSALRKVAVEGPPAATTSRNVFRRYESQAAARTNNGQHVDDDQDIEETQSPQRPKQIDFDAAVATSARDTSSLRSGSATNTSTSRACSNGDKKHVRFDAAASSIIRGEPDSGAGSVPTSTAPTTNVTPSHAPPAVKTEASSSSSAARNSRHATPSPVQGDCDPKSKDEEMRSNTFAISSEERYKRLRDLIKPDMDWSIVFPTLKDRGWAVKPGRGLVSFYYCCSKFADESVAYMLKHAKRGDEYFCSDEELMIFCREKLGWGGRGSDSGDRRRGRTGTGTSCNFEAKNEKEPGRPRREATAKLVVVPAASYSTTTTRKKPAGRTKASRSTSDRSDSSDSSFGHVPLTPCAKEKRSVLLKVDSITDRGKVRPNPGGGATKATKKNKRSRAKEKKKPEIHVAKGQKPGAKGKKLAMNNEGQKAALSRMAAASIPTADPCPTPPPPSSAAEATSAGSSESEAGPETILSDQHAWRFILLPVFKFRFNKNYYCLPGTDPKSNEAVEGKDYFKRITSLRRHLCAYGIPLTALVSAKGKTGGSGGEGTRRSSRHDVTGQIDIDSLLHKDDRRALERWVRYAVSRSLALQTEVPADIERFPPKSFMHGPWQLLQKLGYKFSSGAYKVPTAEGSAISFDRAEDLEAHLARFGLVENTSALNREELLKLELYIAGCSDVDSFRRIRSEDQNLELIGKAAPISSAPSSEKNDGSENGTSAADNGRDQQKMFGASSPSSLKTVKASGAEEDGAEEASATPRVPQMLVFNQLPPSTNSSVLSENSFNPTCPNGIPEVGDDEGRNAVMALSLGGEVGDDIGCQEDMMGDEDDDAAMKQVDCDFGGREKDDKLTDSAIDDSVGKGPILCNSIQSPIQNQRGSEDDEEVHLQEGKVTSSTTADAETEAKRSTGQANTTCSIAATAIATDSASGRKRLVSAGESRASGNMRTGSSCNKRPRKSSHLDQVSTGVSSDLESTLHTSPGHSKCDGDTVNEPLPDGQPTILDKLRCCQCVLHSDHVDDMYRKSSRVESHANRITKFLTKAMRPYYEEKRSYNFEASSMYVCGGPGTGKTTTLNKCINKCKDKFPDARFIFRNATSCGHDGVSAAARILNDIKGEIQAGPTGEDASYTKIENRLSRRTFPLVLVLDEIDMLLSYSNRSMNKLSGGDLLIKHLLNWAANEKFSFVLIGISNAVDNGYTERLQSLGKISHTLVFKPYREEDLISIIEARVGTKIIAEPAIKMVSRKVAAGSGDARKALDMTAQAVRKCETDLSVEQLAKSGDGIVYPIVKLPHMMRSIREGLGMKHTDAIMSMPQAAKIVLCVAVALSTVSPAWKIIRMKDLKKYCAEASRHGLMERLNIDHLFDIVQMLSDSGLLLSGDGNDLRYAAYQMDVHEIPLMLGVQLDDVECALEKTLMNEPFYKNMVSYVRKHHR